MSRRPASWLATLNRDDLALITNIASAKIHIGRLARNKVADEATRGVKPLTLDHLHAWSGLWNALPLCHASGGRGSRTYYWEPLYAHGSEAEVDEQCKACFSKWRAQGSPTVRGWTDRKEAGDWPLPFGWKPLPTVSHPWDVPPGVSLDTVRDNKGEVVGEPRQELHRWQRGTRVVRVNMELFGVRSQVVVDVLHERDRDRDDDRSSHADLYRWHPWRMRFFAPSEDVLVKHLEADADTDFRPELQIPVHPLVPCFDLRRHVRLRVHINNLEEYKYRRDVSKGLIIPEQDRRLIDLLVDHSADKFEDVVAGKGQSMNILSGGVPGTGKTLTAEVFAEYKERPLYSVQCSQLGLKPDDIEKNLGIILQRANRWNAILLLDEADVYIRTRGDNLQQNAIVGVFLRMLEYAQCILFMTTNLPEAVDDAIASRCIVRLGYDVPTNDAQAKIWRTLVDINEIKLADKTIEAFVERHPGITGRDVKNLLKLANLIGRGGPLKLETLEYALQYKPTSEMKARRK